MGDFKKRSSFGGGRDDKRGGGFRGSSFGGGSKFGRGGAGGGFRQSEMFSTTCAECRKSCEVPFRPNGEKPVYCSDCFRNKGGSSDFPQRESRGRDFPKWEFSQPARPQFDGGNTADLKKQLESMSSKLDRLMEMVMKNSAPVAQESASKRVDAVELAKVVKKATDAPKKEVKKVVAPVKKVEVKKVEVKVASKKKPVSKKK